MKMKSNYINMRVSHAKKMKLKQQADKKEVSLSKHILDEIDVASLKIAKILLAKPNESGHLKLALINFYAVAELLDQMAVKKSVGLKQPVTVKTMPQDREVMELSKLILESVSILAKDKRKQKIIETFQKK